jgi:hypothetical protein
MKGKILFIFLCATLICSCIVTKKRRNDPDDVERVKKFIVEFHKRMEDGDDLSLYLPKWEKSNISEFVSGFRGECQGAQDLFFEKIDVLYKETDGEIRWEGLVHGVVKCRSGAEERMEISIDGDSLGLQIRGYNAIKK